MSESKRHHFLPVFYAKGFANPDGFFYVFDVIKNVFKNNGRKFAPSTQFYEHYGNTTTLGGTNDNYIEEQYSQIDKQMAAIIQKVAAGGRNNLNEHEWQMIQYFVNIIYWRIPANTQKVKDYIDNATSLKDFRMLLKDQTTGELASENEHSELLKKIKEDREFYKYIKLALPAITYPEIFAKEFNNSATIFTFPFELPKLLGDNPIIFRNPGKVSRHHDDFVFPLTPQEILFRHRLKNPQVHTSIRILIDMMQVLQANEYVVSSDLEYPIKLLQTFSDFFSSVDELRTAIFAGIFGSEG